MTDPVLPSPAGDVPVVPKSRGRFWAIVTLLSVTAFFNYFDRQTVSVLKTTLKVEFAMDDAAYALLLNVFTACYAFAYVASGWVVDRLGARCALTGFVSLWSAVTVACGFARSFWELAVLRGMLGLAEPGLFPVMIRAATVWTEDKGRGVFMSLSSLGSSIATISAVPLIVWLTVQFQWRIAFVLPGVCGLAAAAAWWLVYREPTIAAAPRATAEPPASQPRPALSWRHLWRQRALWGIILCRLVSDPVWYFCVFWMPGYLQENKGVGMTQLGLVGWIPFLAGNIGGLGFAALSDLCARHYGVVGRKRLVMGISILGPLCAIIPQTSSLAITLLLFCIVIIVCNAWLGSLAPIISELFPVGNVASVWGIAGAFGALGAMVFNYYVGHVAATLGPQRLFLIMALLHPCAALTMHFVLRSAGPSKVRDAG